MAESTAQPQPYQVASFKKYRRKIRQLGSSTKFWKGTALVAIGLIVFSQFYAVSLTVTPRYKLAKKGGSNINLQPGESTEFVVDASSLQSEVIPADGVVLPITWGDLGQQMISDGVVDEAKFRALFPEGFKNAEEQIFSGNWDEPIVMTQENSRFILDVLWAFGLANKNPILETGEMMDEEYGGAGNFASTGGWSLAQGAAMDHYSMHSYVSLNEEEQSLVDRVSRGIFRPCCGNSTHFPDCNHGMAMLGLLELMAANGATEEEMYKVALDVNAIWFPQTYVDLATYFKEQGTEWKDIDPQLVLGAEYSSAQGYQATRQQIQSLPKVPQGGGGCGA